ncbi:MAG: TonB-dependent receptor [Pseudomonadota bacterium]
MKQKALLGSLALSAAMAPLSAAQSADKVVERNAEAALEACLAEGGSRIQCRRSVKTDRLDTVQVFGDRPLDAAGSSSLLLPGDIEDIAPDHPAELLNTLPGVNIHINSGQEHLLAIRSPVLTGGAGQGSFLILENGVPTRSPAFGNVNILLEPHFETAEYIEVVRGPGSAKYGSNAVHGLVNVLLADPQERSANVHGSVSSLGRYKTDLVLDQGFLARGGVSVQKDTGWRDNTSVFQLKGSGVAETVLGGWAITAWGSASHLEQETADFVQGPDAYEDRDLAKANDDPLAYRDAWSARGAARFERDFAEGRLSLTPFARVQQMDFRQHFLPYKGFEKNGHTGGGVMARYDRDLSDEITFRVGADTDLASGYLRESQPEPFGFFPGDTRFPVGIHYDYTVDTIMGALWSEVDWQASERMTLHFGLRAEAHEYDYTTDAETGINGRFNVPEDRSDSFDFITPKLGLVYEANDTIELYANYARGARAPQASDLYRLQSQQVAGEVEVETLDSLEIGARGVLADGALVFDLAAYAMEKDNFFFRDADGLNVPNGATEHIGIELGADWRLNETLSVRGNIAWSDQTYAFDRPVGNASEAIEDGDQIDTAPEWLADLAVIWSPVESLELGLSADYVGEYFTNPSNTETYPGHTVLTLRGAYEVSPTLETYVTIRNLTDETYADRADFAFGNERYFPGEPLNITFGLRKVIQ